MRTRIPRLNLAVLISLIGICIALLSSCSDSRIYDEFHDLDDNIWHIDSAQRFSFDINAPGEKYNLFYLIRNTADYSYYNLYLKFSIEDSLHQVIASELQEVMLFDAKTGKPYGGGLGDIFSHEFPVVEDITFPYKGKFTFSVQQYMRVDALDGIQSLGLKIERAVEE